MVSFQFCDPFHLKSKILLLAFKILNDLALNYLTVLLNFYSKKCFSRCRGFKSLSFCFLLISLLFLNDGMMCFFLQLMA